MMPVSRVAFGAAHQIRVTFDNTNPFPETKPDLLSASVAAVKVPPPEVKAKKQILGFEAVTRLIVDKMQFALPFHGQPKITIDVTYPESSRFGPDNGPPSPDLVVRVLTDTPPERLKEDRAVLQRVMRGMFRQPVLSTLEIHNRLENALNQAHSQLPSHTSSDLFARVLLNAARPTDVVFTADELGLNTTWVNA